MFWLVAFACQGDAAEEVIGPSSVSSDATTPPSDAAATTSSTVVAVTPMPTMTETIPPTTLAPLPDPELGTGEEEAVPLGEVVDIGDWRIGVSEAVLDATELVLNEVPFNDPPAADHQFLLIELTGVFQGSSRALPVFGWKLVSEGNEFVPDGLECGVIPNSIYDLTELGNGEEFTASICFEVPSAEVGEMLLLFLNQFGGGSPGRFFALQ